MFLENSLSLLVAVPLVCAKRTGRKVYYYYKKEKKKWRFFIFCEGFYNSIPCFLFNLFPF
jgi:hypothetical protein